MSPTGVIALAASEAWMLVAIVVLLILSVFLAVAESALLQTSRVRATALVEEGRKGADRLLAIVSEPERYLNAVLLVVLVCQLVQATLVGVVSARLLGAWGVLVATTINVVVVFVIAEAAPKTWALQHPARAALGSAPLVAFIGSIPPLRLVAQALIGLTNVILPGKGLRKGPWISEEELLALAEAAAEESVIEMEERDLIESIIEFGDTVAREIMVPRTDMVAMDEEFRVTDVVEMAIHNGLSRLPVYSGTLDDVVGVVYIKDLMRVERDGNGEQPVGGWCRPAWFVPETKRAAPLLREMQALKNHLAIVVDEYGGTAGLVTLEDLLEELVGEIHDEFDTEMPEFRRVDDRTIVVFDPSVNVDDINEALDIELPEGDGDWDSIGGLVFSRIGQAPTVGDRVEVGDYMLVVDKVDGRRVAKMRIIGPAPAATDREAPA